MDIFKQSLHQFLSSYKRTMKLSLNGKPVWFKRGLTHSRKAKLRRLRNFIAQLNNNPMYYSTEVTTPDEFNGEIKRIQKLHQRGVRVPEIIAYEKDWVAMSDIGPSLREIIGDMSTADSPDIKAILLQAASELGKLHQQGMWHGRPALRDMTWDGEHIGFVDFEEDPAQYMEPLQCQARDLLAFIHSLSNYYEQHSSVMKQCVMAYRSHGPDCVWQEASRIAASMWACYGILAVFHRLLGKEGKQVYQTLRILTSKRKQQRRKLYVGLFIFGHLLLLMRTLDI